MQHDEIVKRISENMKRAISTGCSVKIVKDTVSHLVPNPYEEESKMVKLDVSGLNRVLSIDPTTRTCVAESGVSFSDLVTATMKYNLIPTTVPELKHITIGGAVAGCSVESMSYKLGGFHDSCLEYEAVTGTGEITICSPERNADLFHMLHGSYGTLGVLTKLTFKLLPAKPYVHMQYLKYRTFNEYWKALEERCEAKKDDFIDGIIHADDCFVICVGTMVDRVPRTSNYDWLKIYYKSTLDLEEDYLTVYDYFFRYDAECHWLTKTVPLMETLPARFMFGKFLLGSTNLIKWSGRLKRVMRMKRRPEVVVDVFIPSQRFKEFYEWYRRDFVFYPLWIVPYQIPTMYPWVGSEHAKGMGKGFFIDCAIYGKKNNLPDVDYSELLEKKTIELGGIKTLISRNHFDRETFWKVYNKANYDKVKSTYDPHHFFKDMYEQFNPQQQ
jgi:FAD/FMN-containing dehydrogenase